MTITRRDVMMLAAAATSAAPFAVDPAREAALLAEPAEFVHEPMPTAAVERDPVAFAVELHADGNFGDWFDLSSAPELAAFDRALNAVAAIVGIPQVELPLDHPLFALQGSVHGLWNTSFYAGLRAGAAYEHVRQALVAPVQICKSCWGDGFTDHDERWAWKDPDRKPRGTCGGTGSVPTPPAVLNIEGTTS